jgi:catechol 2,3-dioxygenase-like lactoylglutathione lyase family enzyme
MNGKSLLPLVVTNALAETKAFYTDKLGFSVTIEVDGYLQVRYGGEDGPELAFMKAGPTPAMGDVPRFDGRGLIVSIPTSDADAAHAAMTSRGAAAATAPSDKPWKWRSFTVVDPNGVVLDFFHVLPQSPALDATG